MLFGDGERESTLLTACKKILRMLEAQGKIYWERVLVTGVPRVCGNRKYYTKNTEQVGHSDLDIWLPDGRTIHVELKSKTGKQSDDQKTFQERAEKMKRAYYIVRTVEELEDKLRENGVDSWFFKKRQA